jgi:pimeloyl-ACP methyl ester carboxylesterase
MPLVVLARTSGGYESGMNISPDSLERDRRRLMADLAALSTRGRLIFATASGHNIHLEQPELVVTAIREVVRSSRRRG